MKPKVRFTKSSTNVWPTVRILTDGKNNCTPPSPFSLCLFFPCWCWWSPTPPRSSQYQVSILTYSKNLKLQSIYNPIIHRKRTRLQGGSSRRKKTWHQQEKADTQGEDEVFKNLCGHRSRLRRVVDSLLHDDDHIHISRSWQARTSSSSKFLDSICFISGLFSVVNCSLGRSARVFRWSLTVLYNIYGLDDFFPFFPDKDKVEGEFNARPSVV